MFCFSCRDCSGFVNLKIFPSLSSAIGLSFTFILHGLICLTACLVVFLFLPETKGLTLSEINNLSQKEKMKSRNNSKTTTSSNSTCSSNSFSEDVEEAFKIEEEEDPMMIIQDIRDEEKRNLVMV